ncbi:unnamed protein product, partial [Lymnaea stagnalis]
RQVKGPCRNDPSVTVDDLLTPCSPGAPGAIEMSWKDVPSDKLLEPIVSKNDMLMAINNSKATVSSEDLKKLQKFTNDFGMEG